MTIQDILDELGDHGFTDTGTPRKLFFINDTIWDICSRRPWPFLESTVDLTFDGTNPYPTNFPSDWRTTVDIIDPVKNTVMMPMRIETLDKTYGSTLLTAGNGPARSYYFLGDQLRFYPVPSATDTARMRYIRRHPQMVQTNIETDILIPREHHRANVMGTLWKLYDMEDDPELASRFEQHYENRLNTMAADILVHQYDRPDIIVDVMGDGLDEYYF